MLARRAGAGTAAALHRRQALMQAIAIGLAERGNTVDELGRILQEIVGEEQGGADQNPLSVAEFPPPNLDDYVISLQAILSEFRKILVDRLRETGKATLSELVRGLSAIDAARVFILLLFAANSGEVVINQEESEEDALVVSVGQLE